MIEPIFKVIKPGLQTSVQDLGRTGYQQYGMSPSGAMDSYSMQLGNLLNGNALGEAVLEIAMIGPALEALNDISISICGGDLEPKVNGRTVPMWRSFVIKKGDILTFGQVKTGGRGYISFAGGLEVPIVLGSRSTFINGRTGGYQGRALQAGDILHGRPMIRKSRRLHSDFIPEYPKDLKVRVILGPHLEKFSQDTIDRFLTSSYKVSAQSNRMGLRLEGPKLNHIGGADIISDAIPFGGIQVPASGEPIILMAERQTTGGYPRIGTVISADLPLLAQAMPGAILTFEQIDIEDAQKLYIEQKKKFRLLALAAGISHIDS
jgi:antagonist of KipI